MNHPAPSLRVLHVEDNAHDAELIQFFLQEEWPDCRVQRVQTREEFLAALDGTRFDLVLSDFTMPRFDGLTALELLRQRSVTTPFIFLSGTISQESAVYALRRGATDFMNKDHAERLVPAIRQALAQIRPPPADPGRPPPES